MSGPKEKKKPELLAPAGNLASALAALKSGADAVYAGLGTFNAREMGENFDYEDMSRLSARTKALRRKLYITLNTLIKEGEIDAFAKVVNQVASLEPDAVIVQDIGVVRFLRENYPWLEIHASTQMGIHNTAGIEIAKRMGISRVILERQVTMDELSAITDVSPLPVEVFVHGALCCSLSGSCLLSSWMGGSSGNRGKCKQPCRRRYHAVENGRKSGSGFFLSTKDLYTLDMLDALAEAGVSSLKIEGRLKKPDYVARVVRAYRLILDAEDTGEALGKARGILSGAYGRKWSHGFATNEDAKTLIDEKSIGVSGQLVGKVAGIRNGGFVVSGTRRIHIGDRLRIQAPSGNEAPSFTVTKLGGNEQGTFVFYDRDVPANGLVYRVGSSQEDWEPDRDALPRHVQRTRVDALIRIQSDILSVTVTNSAGKLSWSCPLPTEQARTTPLSSRDVESLFRATRSAEIVAGCVEVDIQDGLFVQARLLKEARREFWNWVAERRAHLSMAPPHVEHRHRQGRITYEKGISDCYLASSVKARLPRGGILVSSLSSVGEKTREIVLPAFCPESKLASVAERIREAYADNVRRFRVTSLYQIALLDGIEGLKLTASYPLPAANSYAAAELSHFGIAVVQGWLELERPALEALRDASPVPVEIYRYGRPSLLSTRAMIPASGSIQDSHGKKFRVSRSQDDGLTHVFSDEVMSIPPVENTASFFDYSHAAPRESSVSEFNFSRELV